MDVLIPYIEGEDFKRKAGLLTLFRRQAPSRPVLWAVVSLPDRHKGTYSCETVGDFHSVPFLIELIEPYFRQRYAYFVKVQRNMAHFIKYFL